MTLKDKTVFISGGSRGIGLEIALRAARDGANVALIAKTGDPNPKLAGTVYTAAAEIEAAGGQALPIVGDIRDEGQVEAAVAQTVERFGGINVCINNASAINLSGTEALDMKRYDLMQDINTRGTFVVSRACIPHLRKAQNPHILTLSPPISIEPRWLGPHVAYTIAKYGMSMCALGFAAELKADGIASNALWPRTLIATAAVQNLLGGDKAMAASRKPRAVRGCGLRRDHPGQPRVHGEHVPVRGRARRGGRDRLRCLRVCPRLDAPGRLVRRPRLGRDQPELDSATNSGDSGASAGHITEQGVDERVPAGVALGSA